MLEFLVISWFSNYSVLIVVLELIVDWSCVNSGFSLMTSFPVSITTINSGFGMTLDFIFKRYFYLSSFSLILDITTIIWTIVHSSFTLSLSHSFNWCCDHSWYSSVLYLVSIIRSSVIFFISLIMRFFIIRSLIHFGFRMFLGFRNTIILTIYLYRGAWRRLILLLIF